MAKQRFRLISGISAKHTMCTQAFRLDNRVFYVNAFDDNNFDDSKMYWRSMVASTFKSNCFNCRGFLFMFGFGLVFIWFGSFIFVGDSLFICKMIVAIIQLRFARIGNIINKTNAKKSRRLKYKTKQNLMECKLYTVFATARKKFFIWPHVLNFFFSFFSHFFFAPTFLNVECLTIFFLLLQNLQNFYDISFLFCAHHIREQNF